MPVGFRHIIPKPRQLQHKRLGEEKDSRTGAPSGAKSPGKRRFSAVKPAKDAPKLGSKRWQIGARIAWAVAAVGVRGATARGF
jgi:hypothetical protein